MQQGGITGAVAGHSTCRGGHIKCNRRGITHAQGGAYQVQEEFSNRLEHTDYMLYFTPLENLLIFYNLSLIIKEKDGRQEGKNAENGNPSHLIEEKI